MKFNLAKKQSHNCKLEVQIALALAMQKLKYLK